MSIPQEVNGEILVGSASTTGFYSITGLTNGGFVVFTDGSRVHVFDASGVELSDVGINATLAGYQSYSTVTDLTNGCFVVTWANMTWANGNPSDFTIKAQIFDANGATVGSEILVNTTTAGGRNIPTITGLLGGGFAIAWVDGSGLGGDSSVSSIKAQVFDANGTKVSDEFLVNTTTENQQNFPGITDLSNGGFVVTWSDRSGLDGDIDPRSIKAQVFDATGTKVGNEFLVNTTTKGSQNLPVVASLSDGGFVISWVDQSGVGDDSSGTSIKAQMFDATGAKVGSEFLVNTTTTGDQSSPAINGLSNGDFIIAWADMSRWGVVGGGASIKAQVFDATGVKVGNEFVVNDATAGWQGPPTITGLTGSSFVIAWDDNDIIRAQIFGTNDNAPVITTDAIQMVAENTQVVAALTSTDVDAVGRNPAIFSITGGVDAALFHVVTAPDGSQSLQFLAPPDYETNPHSYQVQVTASDGINSASETLTVNITDANDNAPVVTTAATQSVAENTTLVAALTSTDADTVGTNPPQFSITGGADAALFDVVDSDLVFKTAPNYETAAHSYQVEVSANDGVNTTAELITVNLTDVNEAPTAVALANATASILENTPTATHIKVADINVTDDALGSNILGLTGADAASFEIVGSALYLKAGTVLDFESQASYSVAVTVDDPSVGATPDATSTIYELNVSNVPGVTITGTNAANTIDATHTVAGQPLPTNEEDTINAGGGNDTIHALGGNDFINGDAGADTMFGGTGNDTYVVDNSGDIVNETGGNGLDTVHSSITFSLSDAVHAIGVIENLTLTGTSNVNGTGNAANNVITGNAGNNVLAGLGGADTLDGGTGTDTATYAASPAGVSVSLATGHASGGDAQGDTLINFENLTGSAFNDTLEGNGGNNVLVGGASIDTLSYEHAASGVTVSLATTAAQNTGGAGTDTVSGFENLTGSGFGDVLTGSSGANVLSGLDGNDTLKGGGGADTLTGGAGNDKFLFTAATDSTPSAPDIINDFVHGADNIDFSAIDANSKAKGDQAFAFAGPSSSVVANSVTWFESGGNTIVQADVNGNTTADLTIVLTGLHHNLTASDFIL